MVAEHKHYSIKVDALEKTIKDYSSRLKALEDDDIAANYVSLVNLPAKKIRKNKIPEILFNCFAVPSDLVGIIGVQHIAVVRIDDKESIHFLRKEI
ncbi:unnamed protein product [Rhizophagus irregularis]|nr:unnamed protein product [Rhizophagus irregularis]